MKRRILALLLVLSMVMVWVPSSVFAAETTSGTCGDNLTWVLEDGVLTISGTGEMTNYNGEYDRYAPWNDLRDQITKVVISDGVTSIGDWAFTGSSMETISIPDTVTSIGRYTFMGCRNMEEIELPDSVKSIGWGAFQSCSGLKSLIFPDGVTEISGLMRCNALTSLTIPKSVKKWGWNEFGDSLKDVYYLGTWEEWQQIKFDSDYAFVSDNIPAVLKCIHFIDDDHNHDYAENITCTDTIYTCKYCEVYYTTGSGAGHSYGDWNILEDSDGEAYVHKVRTCTACGQTEARISGTNVVQYMKGNGDNSLTRAGLIVYLWYLNGCPEPESLETVYTDLDPDAYYYKACLWAVEQRILTGVNATTFEPGYELTRGQLATILWRAAGQPDVDVEDNPFSDLVEASSYYKGVLWAYQTQQPIAANVTGTEFEPKERACYADLMGVACYNWHDQCVATGGTEATCQHCGKETFTCSDCGETYSRITAQAKHRFTNYILDESTGVMVAACDYAYDGCTETRTSSLSSCWDETVVVDGTSEGNDGVTIGSGTIETLAYSAARELVIKTNEATVAFDTRALEAMVKAADDVTLTVKLINPDETNLTVSDDGVVATLALSISLCDGTGNSILPVSNMNNNGTITVTVPYQQEDGTTVIVYYVDENGLKDPVEATVENGYLTFTTSHFSNYVVTEVSTHDWNSSEVTTKATCEKDGVMTYTCGTCGKTKTVKIPATGHSYETKVVDPTCTEKGYTLHTCKNCGNSYKDTYAEATDHDYKSVVTEPTCTAKGYTTHTCENCGDSYKDTYINATGHSWDSGKVTTEATCEKDGVKTYTCQTCGETKTEKIAATGHKYESKVVKPTCTEKGYTLHTCKNCGDSYKDTETAATGHNWDSGKVTTKATCEKDGVKTYTCQTCGETKTEKISATGHNYESKVVKPTCAEKGYTLHTCKNCNDSYKDTYTDATGHSWDEGVVTKAPTATEKGVKTYTCKTCGKTKTEEIAVLSNPFTDLANPSTYYDAVLWAVDKGITTGTDKTHFSPKADCTRAQIITFLWRYAGEPEPTTTTHNFVDIVEDSSYYKAVLWAVEEGITTGADSTHFNPKGTCTRAQIVTFLWRYAGKPQPSSQKHSFTDLVKESSYYDAVLWAVEKGITTGADSTHFNPKDTCTRAQGMTFLYRYHNTK